MDSVMFDQHTGKAECLSGPVNRHFALAPLSMQAFEFLKQYLFILNWLLYNTSCRSQLKWNSRGLQANMFRWQSLHPFRK